MNRNDIVRARSTSEYVSLVEQADGNVTQLAGPQRFEVIPLREGTLEGASPAEIAAFREKLEVLQGEVAAADYMLDNSMDKVAAMKTALDRSDKEMPALYTQLHDLEQELMDLDAAMNGNHIKEEIGERTNPTISGRMYTAMRGLRTTYGPTDMHAKSLQIAQTELTHFMPKLRDGTENKIPAMESALESAGAPWIEGMPIPK